MNIIGGILYAIDVFICQLILLFVFWKTVVGISISGLSGRALEAASPPWWAKTVSWVCNWFQEDHCAKALAADRALLAASVAFLGSKP